MTESPSVRPVVVAARPMLAWIVDDDVSYYIAARNIQEALAIYFAIDEVRESIDDLEDVSILRVTADDMRGITVHDDGTDTWEPLVELLRAATEPGLLAGSEWP